MKSGTTRAFQLRFRPAGDERNRSAAAPRRLRWLCGALAIQNLVSVAFYCAQLASFVLVEHRPLTSGIGLQCIALIGLNALLAAAISFGLFGLPRWPKSGAEVDVRIDEAGLWFGGDRPRVVPWRKVAMIRDTGRAIAFHSSPLGADLLVVPKRMLADGGAALWSFLDDRLVGKYRLIRSPNTARVIFPSKAA